MCNGYINNKKRRKEAKKLKIKTTTTTNITHLNHCSEADFRGHGAAVIDARLSVTIIPAIQLHTTTALHQIIDISIDRTWTL
jgi:CRISPR/Cas system type I-B associated protein Csh2 (Cas7 group RAMP superfamily)